jgi:hypothetical protein
MKTTLIGFALLLAACNEDPTLTFGLEFRVADTDTGTLSAQMCRPPGEHDGNVSGTSIDDWAIDEAPPHLFLDAEPDGEANAYHVQVYSASERDDGIWWLPSEILADRTYDAAFGEGGGEDSFVVDFEGQRYTVTVLGLPPDATCP